ncbi:unnamed protein product, partial [Ostreobium quekettii]
RHHKLDVHLLERWLDGVLDVRPLEGVKPEPLQRSSASLKGLARCGLRREDLCHAGLSAETIDRLYRALYVYSVGFFDLLQELLCHSTFRKELLTNVWKSFGKISEMAMKSAFKSDYLALIHLHEDNAQQLFSAKEALAEAREDNIEMEKTLAWLTASHAEERALRLKMGGEFGSVKGALEREQVGHAYAVKQYLGALEE